MTSLHTSITRLAAVQSRLSSCNYSRPKRSPSALPDMGQRPPKPPKKTKEEREEERRQKLAEKEELRIRVNMKAPTQHHCPIKSKGGCDWQRPRWAIYKYCIKHNGWCFKHGKHHLHGQMCLGCMGDEEKIRRNAAEQKENLKIAKR